MHVFFRCRLFPVTENPRNLLIDRKFHLKIGDFGLARTFELPVKKYSDKVKLYAEKAPSSNFPP